MSRPLRRLGAIVTGLVLVGATGAVVAADALTPAPAPVSAQAPAEDVPPTAVSQVCAGPPELALGEGMSVDPELDPADTETATRARVASLPRGGGDPGATSVGDLAGEEVHELGATAALSHDVDVTGPMVLTAKPAGEEEALAGGATVSRTNAGDARGLVATPCLPAVSSAWFVGGSTDVAASAVLVLTNLGPTAATVDLTAWGSTGPVEAPSGIVVAPNSQERVLLEGALTSDPRVALRVNVSGGSVAASIQTHAMTGIVAGGLDSVSPTTPPTQRLTVPAVTLTGTDADGASALRLVNPGEEPATVAVSLLGAEGEEELPGAEEVVVDPGAVFEVSLAGLPEGTYAVALDADEPVTAAVRTERVGTAGEIDPDNPPVDHAWSSAAEPLTSGLLAVPPGIADRVTTTLTNPAGEDTAVEIITADGTERVTVPARSTVTAPLDGAAQLRADGEGVVVAALLTAEAADGELISVLPATADLHEARTVRVDVR